MPRTGPQLKQPHMPAAPRGPVDPGLAPRDELKTIKLAQRVEGALKSNRIFEGAKQIEPQPVLVAPLNRGGAPPNVQHVHFGILGSFMDKGFDSTRPQIGICVEFKSPERKNELLEHNKSQLWEHPAAAHR